MCEIQCTGEEIAGVLGISYDTLIRRIQEKGYADFAEYLAEKGAEGKRSLRRRQWSEAMGGSTTMLIWLGKQMLGQTDRSQIDQRNEVIGQANITYSVAEPDQDEEVDGMEDAD